MILVCAWCPRPKQRKAKPGQEVTHGMCRECVGKAYVEEGISTQGVTT